MSITTLQRLRLRQLLTDSESDDELQSPKQATHKDPQELWKIKVLKRSIMVNHLIYKSS